MELESKVQNINIPKNIERIFLLSGLGGSGQLHLIFGETPEGTIIHVLCRAGLPLIKSFHFEALSQWEKTKEGYSFVSYEEKDFSKKILKKWEFGTDGLNFIENKKGLFLEREIQYFKAPDQQSLIFDPISAATVALLENPERDICIFGKQRILHLKTKKENMHLRVNPISGVNNIWSKILEQAEIKLDEKNIIHSIEIPSPIQIGKMKMHFKEEKPIDKNGIDEVILNFRRSF